MAEVEEKSWELSLYESLRTPQEAITDSTEIAVSPKSLQSELTCPICLDMLTTTMTTKECLHRFCAECIITALRSGNKECPTCRKKLVSKRSLRHDPNFDQLVANIFPDREEYEEQQQKALAIASKKHSQLLMSGISSAAKAQADHVKMINRKKNLTDYDELMASHAAVGDNPDNEDESQDGDVSSYRPKKKKRATMENGDGPGLQPNEIEIIFKNHSTLSSDIVSRLGDNKTRYIKTSLDASIDHLAKFLEMRIKLEIDNSGEEDTNQTNTKVENVKLFIFHSGDYIELTGPETLEMVKEDYMKKGSRPLDLHYMLDFVPAKED